jgi:very-short-patch-repair endonuclease
MTDAERALWRQLRYRQILGAKFRRQHPVGPYIADFACLDAMLIVELDGGQHAEHRLDDERRTRVLKQHGFLVLRFWNNDVLGNVEGVVEVIREAVAKRSARA